MVITYEKYYMKILITTIAMMSFGLMAQNQLRVTGKMITPSEKYTKLVIVSNLTDTTYHEIKGKRFKLPLLNSNVDNQLIFTNGGQTKKISINVNNEIVVTNEGHTRKVTLKPKEVDGVESHYLHINWIK